MLLSDRITGLPHKRIVQRWAERISVRPRDIAFVVGRGELNLAIGRDNAITWRRICASHTDFKRAGSNLDGKRSFYLRPHADLVIDSDVACPGGLGVARAGGKVVDVIEDRLFADGCLSEQDRNG